MKDLLDLSKIAAIRNRDDVDNTKRLMAAFLELDGILAAHTEPITEVVLVEKLNIIATKHNFSIEELVVLIMDASMQFGMSVGRAQQRSINNAQSADSEGDR